MIPSKKSGLDEYTLDKVSNYTELTRYFPAINKNTPYKIVGKFLLDIYVVYLKKHKYHDIKIHIEFGEIKYQKTYIENDILKSKSIFDDKIKIEI